MKHKQRETVYLISSIGNLDNLVDFEDESPQTFETQEDAINAAIAVARESGMRTYVYMCKPILVANRGKVTVTRIK